MPLKSPCLSCPYTDDDKNSERCMNCNARIEYIRKLAGDDIPSSSLMGEEVAERTEKPEPCMESNVETKTCKKCNRSLPATLDYFSKHSATKDRLDNRCKQCVSEIGKAKRRAAKQAGAHHKSPERSKENPPASGPGPEKPLPGLTPKSIHHLKRAMDILSAMTRYVAADKVIPAAWFEELYELYGDSSTLKEI